MTNQAMIPASTSTLPQIVPDRATADLIGSFANKLDREGADWFLPVLPTPDEREIILTRQRGVRRAMRAIAMADADRQKAATAITAMLTAWIHTGKADPKSTVAAYVMHLQDMPLFAIERACSDIAKGNVSDLNPDFPPSAARLHQLAAESCETLAKEDADIGKILIAKVAYVPPPEERERVRAGFEGLTESMKAWTSDPEASQRRAVADRRVKEASERAVLRQYETLGVEPQYATDGILVSPSLLKLLGRLPAKPTDSDDFQEAS